MGDVDWEKIATALSEELEFAQKLLLQQMEQIQTLLVIVAAYEEEEKGMTDETRQHLLARLKEWSRD